MPPRNRKEEPLREAFVERRTLWPEDRVRKIMEGFPQRWRQFPDGDWIVLEGPLVEMAHHVGQSAEVHAIETQFRYTPALGNYLRFLLHPPQDVLSQKNRRKRAVAAR